MKLNWIQFSPCLNIINYQLVTLLGFWLQKHKKLCWKYISLSWILNFTIDPCNQRPMYVYIFFILFLLFIPKYQFKLFFNKTQPELRNVRKLQSISGFHTLYIRPLLTTPWYKHIYIYFFYPIHKLKIISILFIYIFFCLLQNFCWLLLFAFLPLYTL